MTETAGKTPENEPLKVSFGDVVRCRPYDSRHEQVVVAVHEGGWADAFAIVDEANHRYGIPGTVPPGQIEEIIEHKDYEQVIEMLAYAFGDGKLTPEMTDFVKRHYPEPEQR